MVSSSQAQEIPLKRCDKLPVIEVAVGGDTMVFLVDTAATSILNLKSFAEGTARDVQITSWSGTLATSAREISLKEVEIGGTKLIGLRLPAIDLSAVGNACGRKIDGILGVDLLKRLGATIDMKRQMVHVATASEEHGDALTVEMQKEMRRCVEAFNNSDEKTFPENRALQHGCAALWTRTSRRILSGALFSPEPGGASRDS
jgi:predicted aspartyl protease